MHLQKLKFMLGLQESPGQTSKMPEIVSGMHLAKFVCHGSHVLVSPTTSFKTTWGINLCFLEDDGEIPVAPLLDMEGPFSDSPLLGDYLRITNISEQTSTSMSLLVNPLPKRNYF